MGIIMTLFSRNVKAMTQQSRPIIPKLSSRSHARQLWTRRIKVGALIVGVAVLVGWNNLYMHTVLHRNEHTKHSTTKVSLEMNRIHKAQSPVLSEASPASNDPTSPIPRRAPTHHACDGYDGIYHILLTDELGGVGTAFFQLVIGQILYAERYNLKPWIHLNNFSKVFYDDKVHGVGPGVSFRMKQGATVPYIHRSHGHRRDQVPGPPKFPDNTAADGADWQNYHFAGTGVWEHYMEPISDFLPGDKSCTDKFYVTMDLYLITPGIHGFSPDLATRCWRYEYLPDYIQQPHLSYHEWLEPQRVRAHDVIQRYFRFRPYLTNSAEQANPGCGRGDVVCLGLHVRHSDKAAGRQVIPLEDFVPFVDAFFQAGGDFVYIATDSTVVMNEIRKSWPFDWTKRIRTLGSNVVRSTNTTAVFDIASHHRTNQEVLKEIIALSKCQFLVHGHSAVSETSIWINLRQHNRSVNLEDSQHISAKEFHRVVSLTKAGATDAELPQPPGTDDWWNAILDVTKHSDKIATASSCDDNYEGILIISEVATPSMMIDHVFFSSVFNQLLLAQKFNLKPVVVLDERFVEFVHEKHVHESTPRKFDVQKGNLDSDGCPILPSPQGPTEKLAFLSSSVWNVYIADSLDSHYDSLCMDQKKAVYWFDSPSIQSMLDRCFWALKSPRVDRNAAESVWNPNNQPWNDYFLPSREKANNIFFKQFRFHSVLLEKASQVNPIENNQVCLGVHFQMTVGPKQGVSADQYLPYLRAFVEVSDGPIYIASDTSRPLRYMEKNFPAKVIDRFRSQGSWVARSTSAETPVHMMDGHHRINSEILVDILALAKCRVLLHTSNVMAESVLYFSPNHTYSINLQDPQRLTPSDMQSVLDTASDRSDGGADSIVRDGDFVTLEISGAKVVSRYMDDMFSKSHNAVVYLAQKKHSTYGRDSYGLLLKSLQMLRKNYLEAHMEKTDVLIFHVSSFTPDDLETIEDVLGPSARGSVRLVDLDRSAFWGRPYFLENSDPDTWYAYPLFSEGYRHMIQFFAIHLWEFLVRLNRASSSQYRYILRLDEDSFLHSPIKYNMFDFMTEHGYVYGYRMCSYEMQTAQRMWKRYQQARPQHVPKRSLELQGCGFYNNFFVADVEFFRRTDVQDFLQFIWERGHIYQWRLGDLMIHTMTIYKFANAEQVHRFLDFTYEHGSVDNKTGCLVWGGMQAGYDDPQAAGRLATYNKERSQNGACALNQTTVLLPDLSPTYAHLPLGMETVALSTVAAGGVEVTGKGFLSG